MPDHAPFENTMSRHVRRTLVLAWPMILTRVGIVTMSAVDVIVLGRAGADQLADLVLGQAVYDSMIGMTIGLLLGVPVLVARETGARNDAASGAIWRRGLVYGLVLGLVLCAALQFAYPVFIAAGQEPELARRAARVTAILGFALPGIATYYVSAAWLEALHRPGAALIAVLLANLSNLVFNIVFVFGWGPFPAMGAQGTALATVLNFAAMSIGLGLYVRFRFPHREHYGIGRAIQAPASKAFELFRIGIASGVSFSFEVTAFAAMTLFVGHLGTLALAAHGVLFQFLALTFMIAYGIAGATQVRVGNAWGRGDPKGMMMAGWTGLALAALLTGLVTSLYAIAPLPFLRVFTTDASVILAAAPVMIWVVLATVFDGGQSVMNSACRGRGDTWFPTLLHFGSYWFVMVPAAWYLAFGAGQGLAGIYQAIFAASIASLGLMSLRFRHLSRAAR